MNIGDKFIFKGFEWVALDVTDEAVTAIMTKAWCTEAFDEDNYNDWRISSIRMKLQEELLPVLGEENLITRTVDLVADNGDKRYGTSEDKVWLLTCDDFRKYREIILQNCDFQDDWWWTLTPWYINGVGYGGNVRYIGLSGDVSYSYAINSHGVAPACTINLKSLESAPTGAIRKEIDDLKERIRKLEEKLQEVKA